MTAKRKSETDTKATEAVQATVTPEEATETVQATVTPEEATPEVAEQSTVVQHPATKQLRTVPTEDVDRWKKAGWQVPPKADQQ